MTQGTGMSMTQETELSMTQDTGVSMTQDAIDCAWRKRLEQSMAQETGLSTTQVTGLCMAQETRSVHGARDWTVYDAKAMQNTTSLYDLL